MCACAREREREREGINITNQSTSHLDHLVCENIKAIEDIELANGVRTVGTGDGALDGVVRRGFTEQVVFEQRLNGSFAFSTLCSC